ncbi:hypothetical protein BSLG_009063 [Batrachochytrium salamandrivorans]|nr:hypothetical protein BSLG_009063 [Batrachochytrium salamandrivorans]
MAPRRIPRAVPWAVQEEWDWVYYALYSSRSDLRLQAIMRVKAWASRGKVPHAIESTSNFVEVSHRDTGLFSMVSETELRMQYSMAFIRFVNGIVDQAQKGAFSASASAIAESLGLPGWFIELRHAATHDKLPPLSLLRTGCSQALQWLQKNYWAIQQSFVADTTHSVGLALAAYKDSRKATARGQNADAATLHSLQDITQLLTADTYPDILIPILTQIGFLVPLAKKKRAGREVDGRVQSLPLPLEQLWIKLIETCECTWSGFNEELLLSILDIICNKWPVAEKEDNVHLEFQDLNQLEVLNESSINFTESRESKNYLETLAAWAKAIITKYGSESILDLARIAKACLIKPNSLALDILQSVISVSPQPHQRLATLTTLLEKKLKLDQQQQADLASPFTSKSTPEISIDAKINEESERTKLKEATHDTSMEDPSSALLGNGVAWTLVNESSWETCPLGTLPGKIVPVLDLPLDYNHIEYLVANGILQIPKEGVCDPGSSTDLPTFGANPDIDMCGDHGHDDIGANDAMEDTTVDVVCSAGLRNDVVLSDPHAIVLL